VEEASKKKLTGVKRRVDQKKCGPVKRQRKIQKNDETKVSSPKAWGSEKLYEETRTIAKLKRQRAQEPSHGWSTRTSQRLGTLKWKKTTKENSQKEDSNPGRNEDGGRTAEPQQKIGENAHERG